MSGSFMTGMIRSWQLELVSLFRHLQGSCRSGVILPMIACPAYAAGTVMQPASVRWGPNLVELIWCSSSWGLSAGLDKRPSKGARYQLSSVHSRAP